MFIHILYISIFFGCVLGLASWPWWAVHPWDGNLFFSLKFFICSLSVSFFRKSGPDQQRFLNLVDTILSFLVVPEAKILVSKEGAAGCSSLVGKIPLIAGIRTHGRKASAGKGITLGKRKSRDKFIVYS